MPVRTEWRWTDAPDGQRSRYERVSIVSCRDCGGSREIAHASNTDVSPPFDESVASFIRFHRGTGRYYNRCRVCEREHVRLWREARRVPAASAVVTELNRERQFGIELELIFSYETTRDTVHGALYNAGLRGWSVKHDGSLSGGPNGRGLEVTSPPMSGEDGFRQLKLATETLRGLGATINRSCGLHVHHDVDDFTMDDTRRLVSSWCANQGLIDGLLARSRREGSNTYCRRLTRSEQTRIGQATTMRDLRHVSIQRYRTLNITSYGRLGTFEIRQHQGSCDYAKIRSWVLFGQAMIEQARRQAVPRQTTITNFFNQLGDTLDATARRYLTGRARHYGTVTI